MTKPDDWDIAEHLEKVEQCTKISETLGEFKECFDLDQEKRRIKKIQKDARIPEKLWEENEEYFKHTYRKEIHPELFKEGEEY